MDLVGDSSSPGDVDLAFVEFTKAHYASLFRTATLLVGRSSAEDLVQDTLTRLYPVWSRVEAADQPLAYVRRSLTNRFLTSRSRKAAGELVVAEVPERLSSSGAHDAVVDRGFAASLVMGLSERQRAAIVLRYYHDLTDADIAVYLGCREVTVRSLISRGLAAMRSASRSTDDARPAQSRGSSR
jgi:RNA polymerase sigma-70 factor (sigma-E family)